MDDKAKKRMALNIKIILLVMLGAAIALFLIQNVANVEIQFMFWSITMRRSTLVLLALGIGVLVGWIFHGIHARTRRRRAIDPHTEPAPNVQNAVRDKSRQIENDSQSVND